MAAAATEVTAFARLRPDSVTAARSPGFLRGIPSLLLGTDTLCPRRYVVLGLVSSDTIEQGGGPVDRVLQRRVLIPRDRNLPRLSTLSVSLRTVPALQGPAQLSCTPSNLMQQSPHRYQDDETEGNPKQPE